MDFMSLLYLMVLVALGWFWLSSIRVLEIARNAGKQACIKANVQLLDDTVASIKLRLIRNQSGRRVLQRTFRFEFSATGNNRIEGLIVMLGETVESITMDPYQMSD